MRGRKEAIRTLSALRARQKPLILCSLRPEIESMLRALRLETLIAARGESASESEDEQNGRVRGGATKQYPQ